MNKRLVHIKNRGLAVFNTWLGVYPLLTTIAWFLDPYLEELTLPLRNLVMSALMVPIMVLLVMPVINKLTPKTAISGNSSKPQ